MILCTLLLALQESKPPAQPTDPAARWYVDESRAQKRVRDLVAFGPRMGGTASGDRAALYIADAFRALGLAVRVVEDSEKLAHAETAWKIRAKCSGHDDIVLASAWPYGFSPTSTGSAPLVLDGEAHGAEPCVVLSAQRTRPKKDETPPLAFLVDGNVTKDGAYPVVQHLSAVEHGNVPAFGLSTPDGERLRALLSSGAKVTIDFDLASVIRRGRPKTVIATLAARAGAPEGHVLFSAHGDSDSGGPGADDNASGVATILEIASAWTDAIRAGKLTAPAREVRFAAWGSEIFSTKDYLAGRTSGGGTCLAVINYDQAGFGSGADQINIEPDDLPANEPLVAVFLAVMQEHAGQAGFPAHWATNKSLGGTDSYVFSDAPVFRENRRPALTLFTSAWGQPEEQPRTKGMKGESWRERDKVSIDYDNYYHSAGDTPANTTDTEPWNFGWCARVGMLGVARWIEALPH